MRWAIFLVLTSSFLAGVFVLAGFGAEPPAKKPEPGSPQRVVIPFDFESRFDEGRYGQMIGDMLWKKLQRQGGYVLPESMLDVRDWCERNRFLPGPDTPFEKMKDVVRKDQAGDIGIWGKVERVAGFDTDVYDLWIYVADFSADPPRMLYEKKVRTKAVSEIPHTYVKEALAPLFPAGDQVASPTDPAVEERWQTGPNLVQGDFNEGRDAPLGWDPLPKYVTRVPEGSKDPKARALRFTFPEDVAGTTGVLYYSDYFPVEAGATYCFQCRWRTTGSAAKVFIKCYDEVSGKYSKESDPRSVQRREVYRSQQNLKGASGKWNVHTEDFTPAHTHYTPRWGRVMLYAYWPAGTVEWDDVVVKQVLPPTVQKKVQRPSLETKVRSEEIK